MKIFLIIYVVSSILLFSYAQNLWEQTNGPFGGTQVGCLAINEKIIVAGTNGGGGTTMGVHMSTDNGLHWTRIFPHGNSNSNGCPINSIILFNGEIYASIEGAGAYSKGVIKSTDNGVTWSQTGLIGYYINYLLVEQNTIYACTDHGLYRTVDKAENWVCLLNTSCNSIAINQNNIFVGGKGIYISSDNGTTWNLANNTSYMTINSMTKSGQDIFVGTRNYGVFVSNDNGLNWKGTSLSYISINSILSFNGCIFAGTSDKGIYCTKDNGITWFQCNQGLYCKWITSFATYEDKIYISSAEFNQGGIYVSSNIGENWEYIGLPTLIINSIISKNENIYVATENGIYITTNSGIKWYPFNDGLSDPNTYAKLNTYCLFIKDDTLFAGTDNGLFKRTKSDSAWKIVGLTSQTIRSILILDNNIYVGGNGTFYKSSNCGKNWDESTSLSSYCDCIININNKLFAATWDGIFISTDNGLSWIQSSIKKHTTSLAIAGSEIIAGTYDGLFISTDFGTNWVQKNLEIENSNIYSLLVVNDIIFAGIENGICLSTNNGDTWLSRNYNLEGISISNLDYYNNYIYVGTYGKSVWKGVYTDITSTSDLLQNAIIPEFLLSQNYPNPFNPNTKIEYEIPQSGIVKINIYDISGKLIRKLINEQKNTGKYLVTWDGRNDSGKTVSSGTYFYQIISGNFVQAKKMILLK